MDRYHEMTVLQIIAVITADSDDTLSFSDQSASRSDWREIRQIPCVLSFLELLKLKIWELCQLLPKVNQIQIQVSKLKLQSMPVLKEVKNALRLQDITQLSELKYFADRTIEKKNSNIFRWISF